MNQKGNFGSRRRNSRRANKLTPSQGILKNLLQVTHLDGLSAKHQQDIRDSRARRRPEELEWDNADEALLNEIFRKEAKAIEEQLLKEHLTDAFYRGVGDRPDLIMNVFFGDGGVGNVSLTDGHPGYGVILPGDKWVDLIMRADEGRHQWVSKGVKGDKTRTSKAAKKAARLAKAAKKAALEEIAEGSATPDGVLGGPDGIITPAENEPEEVTSPDSTMSGQLHKLYVRIPPWLARVAGRELSPETILRIVEQVALAFAKETGRFVIAANVHRESAHDLHLHLIHTDLILERREIPAPAPDYVPKILTAQYAGMRERLALQGVESPSLKVVKAELAKLWASGEIADPHKPQAELGYRRGQPPEGSRERRVSMGPAYVSKTFLWESSGRSPEVASINEQLDHHLTFNAVVVEAAKRDIAPRKAKGAEDVYIDYWLARRWSESIEKQLSDEGRESARKEMEASVQRYVREGRSLPGPIPERDLILRLRRMTKSEERHRRKVEKRLQAEKVQRQKRSELHSLRRDAMRAGLRDVHLGLDANAAPLTGAESLKEIRQTLKSTVSEVEKKARKSGLAKAWEFLSGRKFAEGESDDLESDIKKEAETLRKKSMLEGLQAAFTKIFVEKPVQFADVETAASEITAGIFGKIRNGFQGALSAVFPGRKLSSEDPEEMEKELIAAATEFRTDALIEGLELARKKLLGAEVEPISGSVEDLQVAVKEATDAFRDEARLDAAKAILGDKLVLAQTKQLDPISEIVAEHERLRTSETLLAEFAAFDVEAVSPLSGIHRRAQSLIRTHSEARKISSPVQVTKKSNQSPETGEPNL